MTQYSRRLQLLPRRLRKQVNKMTNRTSSKKPRAAKTAAKRTRAALAKAAKRHFPRVKLAAEKALRAAGLHNLRDHGMTFNVDESSPPCDPKTETCKLSSTGEWMCVPNS